MKANRRNSQSRNSQTGRRIDPRIAIACALAILGGCSEKRVIPSPAPSEAPRPVPPPQPRPAVTNWRQAPQTPGDWAYAATGTQSEARFAGGKLVLRCDRAAATVTIALPATATGPVPVTIRTSALLRTLSASPVAGSPVLAAAIPAADPLLDAMAFSKGRFAVETPGLEALYVPSWTEVSRVIQDCR